VQKNKLVKNSHNDVNLSFVQKEMGVKDLASWIELLERRIQEQDEIIDRLLNMIGATVDIVESIDKDLDDLINLDDGSDCIIIE